MFEWIGDQIGKIIWNNLLMWLYETIYQAAADFFAMMGNMGAEIFDLSWVAAVVQLFSLFGWALFGIGMVTAVFDAAIEYQNGRGNLNMTALNVLKGFFAASMVGVLPIELYRFSISLQNTLSGELLGIFTAGASCLCRSRSARCICSVCRVGIPMGLSSGQSRSLRCV